MPKRKSRRPLISPIIKSRKHGRHVTSEFHRLEQLLVSENAKLGIPIDGHFDDTSCESSESRDISDDIIDDKYDRIQLIQTKPSSLSTLQSINDQMKALGGRRAYQQASITSLSYHSTSKWIIGQLQALGFKKKKTCIPQLLEVGAVTTEILSCSWLSVTAIDLQSRSPKIKKCDFFSLMPCNEYDVVVCSMVLNSVPNPYDRGRMLVNLGNHLKESSSLLFLIIPRTCLDHSWLSLDIFTKTLLPAVGLGEVNRKISPKLYFFICSKQDRDEQKIKLFVSLCKNSNHNTVSNKKRSRNEGWSVSIEETLLQSVDTNAK